MQVSLCNSVKHLTVVLQLCKDAKNSSLAPLKGMNTC